MGKFAFNLQSRDGKRQAFGLLSALLGLVLTLIGNYIFFLRRETAYETFPVLFLGFCFDVAAMRLGSKKLGVASIILSLPAAGICLFIIAFFALGGSR
jgi:peptidoglycan/LPS O-acetylase OafA/YrhL